MKKYLNYIINFAYLLIFSYWSFFTLFHVRKYYIAFQHSVIKTLFFMLAAAAITFLFDRFRPKANAKTAFYLRMICVFFILILQVYFFLKTITPLGWDAGEVVNSAEFGMYNADYFAKHPNNLFLQMLLSFHLKLTRFIPYLSALRKMELLNLFFIDLSFALLWITTRKVTNSAAADKALLYVILLLAFHPSLSVIYSDTISMPFPIGILCCFVYGTESDTRKKYLYYALGSVLCILGYSIKPTVTIMGIALCMILLIFYDRSASKKKLFVSFLVMLIAGFLTAASVSAVKKPVREQIRSQYPAINSRGMLYYISLGLRVSDISGSGQYGYGCYEENETAWMQQHIDHPNYREEAVSHIFDILSDFGAAGYLGHLADKLVWMGSDGTFFYGGEGEFHAEAQASADTVRGWLQNAVYTESSFYRYWFSSFMQGVWLWICIKSALSFRRGSENLYLQTAKLSVIGLVLFLLIFENRSRYLFLYLPVVLFGLTVSEYAKTDDH